LGMVQKIGIGLDKSSPYNKRWNFTPFLTFLGIINFVLFKILNHTVFYMLSIVVSE